MYMNHVTILLLIILWTTESPTRVSQQEKDAVAILNKSGHIQINEKVISLYTYNCIYAYD
jgi:hypothetical protein